MKTPTIIAIVIFSIVAITGIALVAMAFGWYDDAVSQETAVKAQYQDNQNRYDSFWKSVVEVAQVQDKYKEDFKEVLIGSIEGRYGENGSQAMFLFIQEQNPTLDKEVYTKLMNIIEVGRNDFKRSQTTLLDKQRAYERHLKASTGMLFAGYFDMPNEIKGELAPPTDLDGDGLVTVLDYRIVTSKKTKKAFETGEDEALDVYGKK